MKKLLLLLTLAPATFAQTTFSGFLDLVASYNANRPSTHESFIPGTGTSAKRANAFALNLAQLQVTRATSANDPLGFTLALVAGDGDDVVHSGESNPLEHVYQASLAWRANDDLTIEAGIFPCHIGFEGFYSKDNWNYTRSWLGELSPYYSAGIKANYALNEHWSAQLHVLNGWQLVRDSNDDKAVGTQLAYTSDKLTASLNTFVGRETDALRKFADVVMSYRITSKLQLGTSFDIGAQDDARWHGLAVYARYAFTDKHALAIRAEHFRDPDAAISGASQSLREATLTYELRPHEHLLLKLETRLDRSTARVFADDEREQFLALAGAVVTF